MQLVKLDKKANIRVPVRISEAIYDLTEVEQKVITALSKSLSKSEISAVNIYKLGEFCQFPENHIREYISMAAKKLMSRVIAYTDQAGDLNLSHWVEYMKIPAQGDTLLFEVDKRLLPAFIEYAKKYVSAEPKQLMSLSGQYTMRIYQLIQAYHKSHEREILIADIIKMFALEKTIYKKRPSDIIKRIIDPSIININEKTDLQVEYETTKAGRKLYSVILRWKKKSTAARQERKKRKSKAEKEAPEQLQLIPEEPWNNIEKSENSEIFEKIHKNHQKN